MLGWILFIIVYLLGGMGAFLMHREWAGTDLQGLFYSTLLSVMWPLCVIGHIIIEIWDEIEYRKFGG